MKRGYNYLVGLVLGACMLVGCDRGEPEVVAPASTPAGQSEPGKSLPVLIVDTSHALHDESVNGFHRNTPYLLKAGEGFEIESKSFAFTDPERFGRRPNVVRVLYEGGEYSIPWLANSTHAMLDASSMKVLKGSAFTGFSSGKQAAVGIGYEATDEKTHRTDFKEFWVGKVIFTE